MNQVYFHQDNTLVSSSNVIASINTKTSDIGTSTLLFRLQPEWRRVFDQEEVVSFKYSPEGHLASLSVSSNLVFLRLFSVSGNMILEKSFESEGHWADVVFLPNNKLALLLDTTVQLYQTKKIGTTPAGALISERYDNFSCLGLFLKCSSYYHVPQGKKPS